GEDGRRYQRLDECESLTVENVYIRSTALGAGEDGRRGLLNHDAVVVELKDGQQGTLLHIVAEKAMAEDTTDKEEQASGIFIRWMRNFRFQPDQDVKFKCFSRPIRLQEVLQVMKQQPPNYDTITANCWQYAAAVVRDLLKNLQDGVEDFNKNVRNRLGKVLEVAEQKLNNAITVIPHNVGIAGLVGVTTVAAIGVGVGLYSATRPKSPKDDQ
ncbi:hypothetical protein GOP47_0026117, partial [Adiantum capillus-veneris]